MADEKIIIKYGYRWIRFLIIPLFVGSIVGIFYGDNNIWNQFLYIIIYGLLYYLFYKWRRLKHDSSNFYIIHGKNERIGPENIIADTWAYHDYTSITTGIVSEFIAEIALEPAKRLEILTRNRTMLNENLTYVKNWLDSFGDIFQYTEPKGGGMLFITYDLDINSTELAKWLREEKSVFILAGDVYGMDKHFRIGIGELKDYIIQGLERIKDALKERFDV